MQLRNFRGGRTESGVKKDNWKPPKEYIKKHACKDKVLNVIKIERR